MAQFENVPLEGEYNCWTRGFDLSELLLTVCETGKTGLLHFTNSEAEKTLFIREGEVIFARSSSMDDRLGEYLLREGKLTLKNLVELGILVRPGKRFGALLLEQGLLESGELVHAVMGHVRAIVLSLFHWTEAWYGFNEQPLPSKEAITLNMPIARLIVDGVGQIDSWRRISQGVGNLDSVYQRVTGNEGLFRKLDLDTSILEILAILARPKKLEEICGCSQLSDIDVCRFIWVFRVLKWIELVEGEPYDQATGEAEPVSPAAGNPVEPVQPPTGEESSGESRELLSTEDQDMEGLGFILDGQDSD